MGELFVVRHGQSQANSEGIIASRLDSPLTDLGRKQARGTGKLLVGRGVKVIFSSPLLRALDTAKAIAYEVGYPAENIRIDERLIERDAGEGTGKQKDFWVKHPRDDEIEGLESLEALEQRVKEIISDARELSVSPALFVTHNGTAKVIDIIMNEHKIDDFHSKDSRKNAAVHEYDL